MQSLKTAPTTSWPCSWWLESFQMELRDAELRGKGETNLALYVSKEVQCEAWFCDTVGIPSLGLSGNL